MTKKMVTKEIEVGVSGSINDLIKRLEEIRKTTGEDNRVEIEEIPYGDYHGLIVYYECLETDVEYTERLEYMRRKTWNVKNNNI